MEPQENRNRQVYNQPSLVDATAGLVVIVISIFATGLVLGWW